MEKDTIFSYLLHLGHQPAFMLAAQFGTLENTSIRTLTMLSERGKLTAGQIAEALGITPASVTQIIKKLEQTETVERMKSTEDSRVTLVAITAKGKALLLDRSLASQAMTDKLFENFTADEVQQLYGLLQKLDNMSGSQEFLDFVHQTLSDDERWSSLDQLSMHFSKAREIMRETRDSSDFENAFRTAIQRWRSSAMASARLDSKS
ncbi:MarR family winged helix-turn-helix transcriptional regulator [Alloscardovia macacae]|uniref:MarR family transcriptional regulator n=1 Tax=Alloscardovia macacae TaxID=1160091 RepID=A0A261F5Z1_9BIFI|nr:MarR family transcriptional regulator [Alloscardovia macacae]OZG54508.1 MarR family transcriptional regulator [Alloscardovia macacae]